MPDSVVASPHQDTGSLECTFDVVLYEVRVDGDRRRGARPGRRDHLEARIHHVACGPDTGGAGPTRPIDVRETSLINAGWRATSTLR